MTVKVYVAAAYPGRADSPERARVERVYKLVRESMYVELSWDWLSKIDEARDAGLNEKDGKTAFRAQAAINDLIGVENAAVFWLLAPSIGGRGCFFESGYAYVLQRMAPKATRSKLLIVSGPDWQNTIFTELFNCKFDSDAVAFVWLTQHALANR